MDTLYHIPAAVLPHELPYASLPVAALVTGVLEQRGHFFGWRKACWAVLPGTLLFVVSVVLASRDPFSVTEIAGGAIYFVVLVFIAATVEGILQSWAERVKKPSKTISPP